MGSEIRESTFNLNFKDLKMSCPNADECLGKWTNRRYLMVLVNIELIVYE